MKRIIVFLSFLLLAVAPAFAQEHPDYVNEEKEFLAANRKEKGVKISSSGLQYKILAKGKGRKPLLTDEVYVKYCGYFVDGTVFDQSLLKPAIFRMNAVIPGMSEGLSMIGEGGKITLYIPSELAYGSYGTSSVPPYRMLIFDVQLEEIFSE